MYQDKEKLRREGILARKQILPEIRSGLNASIAQKLQEHPAVQSADIIFSYCAFGGEVDLSLFHHWAENCGKKLAYPICVENGEMYAAIAGESGLCSAKYGILAPNPADATTISPQDIDVVIVPCTRFDSDKNRIGMGKGYYDRYLPQATNATKILVAYDVQKADKIYCDDWDISVDIVITDANIYTE